MTTEGMKLVEAAIDEVNAVMDSDLVIGKSRDTLLLSTNSKIDSLTLVRLLLEIERLVEEQTGRSIVVVDESTFEAEQSPFATVGTLASHIDNLLA